MIDWTKPIRRKDGRKTRYLGELERPPGQERRVVALTEYEGAPDDTWRVDFSDGPPCEEVVMYGDEGIWRRDGEPCDQDLENYEPEAPAQKEMF